MNSKRDYTWQKEFMRSMKFQEGIYDGYYWHMYFGNMFQFDLTDVGDNEIAVMANIFSRATEWGVNQKTEQIQRVLGIK